MELGDAHPPVVGWPPFGVISLFPTRGCLPAERSWFRPDSGGRAILRGRPPLPYSPTDLGPVPLMIHVPLWCLLHTRRHVCYSSPRHSSKSAPLSGGVSPFTTSVYSLCTLQASWTASPSECLFFSTYKHHVFQGPLKAPMRLKPFFVEVIRLWLHQFILSH